MVGIPGSVRLAQITSGSWRTKLGESLRLPPVKSASNSWSTGNEPSTKASSSGAVLAASSTWIPMSLGRCIRHAGKIDKYFNIYILYLFAGELFSLLERSHVTR